MDDSQIVVMLITAAMVIFYFLPTVIANSRGRDGQVMIGIGNFLLGWTVLGWVVLLIVAFTGESKRDRANREQIERLMKQQAE